MDIIEISDWASDEIKTVDISQIYLDAPWTVQVREFVPVEGDLLEERWTSHGTTISHRIPRYGLADMNKTANMMQWWIDQNVYNYIVGTLKGTDAFFWDTYLAAFRHPTKAKVSRFYVLPSRRPR